MSITVKVLFFAAARDAVNGESEINITLSSSSSSSSYCNDVNVDHIVNNSKSDDDDTTLLPVVVEHDATTITTSRIGITLQTLCNYFIQYYPQLHTFIPNGSNTNNNGTTIAINEEYISPNEDYRNIPIHHGDTIAIIPPISGG